MTAMEARLNQRHEILRSEMQHTFDDLKETIRMVKPRFKAPFLR